MSDYVRACVCARLCTSVSDGRRARLPFSHFPLALRTTQSSQHPQHPEQRPAHKPGPLCTLTASSDALCWSAPLSLWLQLSSLSSTLFVVACSVCCLCEIMCASRIGRIQVIVFAFVYKLVCEIASFSGVRAISSAAIHRTNTTASS